MSVCRPTEPVLSAKTVLRCGVPLVVAVLMALVFGVASASAALPGKATDAAGAIVSSVTGTAPPSLPSTTPPQPPDLAPPKAPVAVPTVPQVPPVKAPTATTPKSSRSAPSSSSGSGQVSDPGLQLPSPDEVTGGAKGPVAGSMDETDQPVSSVQSGGGGSDSRDVQHSGIRAGKIESAEAAPLGLLRAYVWPAIALGPVGELLGALLVEGEHATLAVPDTSGLLAGLLGVAGVDRAGGSSKSAALSNLPPRDSRDIPVPSDGQISLLFLVIACAALMAWLVFALRREARSAHWHWPL